MNSIRRMMRNLRKRGGSAMTAVVVSVTVVSGSIVVAGITASTLQWSSGARLLAEQNRAVALAEAGPADAYVQMCNDWANVTNGTLNTTRSYGDGTYRTDVLMTNEMVVIRSQGVSEHGAVADVEVAFCLGGGGSTPETPAEDGSEDAGEEGSVAALPPSPVSPLGYAILAGGTIDWKAHAEAEAGTAWIHANQTVKLRAQSTMEANVSSSTLITKQGNGSKAMIYGDAYAPEIADQVDLTGDLHVQDVPAMAIPQINLEPYRQWAKDHGMHRDVEGGEFQLKPGMPDMNPDGGVLFVEGTIHFTGAGKNDTMVMNGCFVATGGFKMSSHVKIVAPEGMPALISEGEVNRQSAHTEIEGLVYIRTGSWKGTAWSKIHGSLIVGGNVEATAHNEFVHTAPSIVLPWGGDGLEDGTPGSSEEGVAGADGLSSPSKVYLVAWQK